ncbi:MAG: hypothetical protein P8Y23_11495, partial [Candidatus Lokiarchaeota archaeon]
DIPLSIIDESKQLTTISIPRGKICDHHFQIFIDKSYRIRGFQRVDYELCDQQDSDNLSGKNNEKFHESSGMDLQSHQREMSLKEIYDEFWEYISEDNKDFEDFISGDIRRKKNLKEKQICDLTDFNPHICKNLEWKD